MRPKPLNQIPKRRIKTQQQLHGTENQKNSRERKEHQD